MDRTPRLWGAWDRHSQGDRPSPDTSHLYITDFVAWFRGVSSSPKTAVNYHYLHKTMVKEPLSAAMLGYENRDPATMLGYAFVAALSIWYLTTYLLSPLRRFPGPFLACKPTRILPSPISPDEWNQLNVDLSYTHRLDEPLAHVSCSTGKVRGGHPRAAQEVRSGGAHCPQRARPGYPRVGQDNLQHQRGLFEGALPLPQVVVGYD